MCKLMKLKLSSGLSFIMMWFYLFFVSRKFMLLDRYLEVKFELRLMLCLKKGMF